MKIVLHTWNDVQEFLALLHPTCRGQSLTAPAGNVVDQLARQVDKADPTALRDMAGIHFGVDYGQGYSQGGTTYKMVDFGGLQLPATAAIDEPDGLPQDIQSPVGPTDTVSTVQVANPVDASGRVWDERIDSSSKEVTGKGLWRARRNVPDDVRAAVLAELSAQPEPDQAPSEDAEPLVTETHALPVEKPEADTEADTQPVSSPGDPAAPVDYTALIAASQAAALDASDSHTDLLTACQGFIGAYGHAAYGELRKHVAPKDETGGKAIQEFTPAERRLMQACIANYLQFA